MGAPDAGTMPAQAKQTPKATSARCIWTSAWLWGGQATLDICWEFADQFDDN